MKTLKTLIITVLAMGTLSAAAECTIVLSLCKPMGINKATRFADNYNNAGSRPNVCMQRARDYYNYCNSRQEVGAEFTVNGVLTISNYVNPNASAYWTKNQNGTWVQLAPSY